MFSLISQNGRIKYDVSEYVCDFESDIELLPTGDMPGSSAYIIENGDYYILTHSGKWVLKQKNNASNEEELLKQIEKLKQENEELKLKISILEG